MGIFSRSAEVLVGTPSFAEKMAGIKKAFKQAYENANTLHGKMEQEIALKLSKIDELNKQIDEINVTKKEAEEFMANISKLIQYENRY